MFWGISLTSIRVDVRDRDRVGICDAVACMATAKFSIPYLWLKMSPEKTVILLLQLGLRLSLTAQPVTETDQICSVREDLAITRDNHCSSFRGWEPASGLFGTGWRCSCILAQPKGGCYEVLWDVMDCHSPYIWSVDKSMTSHSWKIGYAISCVRKCESAATTHQTALRGIRPGTIMLLPGSAFAVGSGPGQRW